MKFDISELILDPDGRFFSSAYQSTQSTVLDVWYNPRFQGGMQSFGGFLEASTGAALAPAPSALFGAAMFIHGHLYGYDR
jgi:hypothetical protein